MPTYRSVIRVSFIVFVILIIFVSVSWVFPTLMPSEYYLNAILAISTASAVFELAKMKTGSSSKDILEGLKSHNLNDAIRTAKEIRSTNDYGEIFNSMKTLQKALRDFFAEEASD